MKFDCRSPVFVKTIQQVSRACSKKQNQTNLQDLHLDLDKHLLTIKATNLEFFCEKSIPVKGIQEGRCLIKGETLLRVMSAIQSEETISCELREGIFSITTKKGEVEIKTTPYEDFPSSPKQGKNLGEIKKETLIEIIKEVSFCAATTEIKPEISSVYLYTKNGELYSVSTDSYRLSEKKIKNEGGGEYSLLLPQKHLGEILQILQEEEGEELLLFLNEGVLSVNVNSLSLSINTISGQFPDYHQLFPKEFLIKVEINKEELQKTLNITTLFNEQYSQVRCEFKERRLTLYNKNETIGQVKYEIDIDKKGEDIGASYNNRFFLEALSHIKGSRVECLFTTKNRPMFLRGGEDKTFTHLLMPLNN